MGYMDGLPDSDRAWQEIRRVARVPASALSPRDIPTSPGVCVWFHGDEPVYIGEAGGEFGLRQRLMDHLATGSDLSRSTLRATIAVVELGVDRSTARARPSVLTADQIAAVNAWLSSCEVGWIECSTSSDAHAMKRTLLNSWRPRFNLA